MAISMLKIRRPLGRLIFNMGIAIPGKTVFLIETAPRIYKGGTQKQACSIPCQYNAEIRKFQDDRGNNMICDELATQGARPSSFSWTVRGSSNGLLVR